MPDYRHPDSVTDSDIDAVLAAHPWPDDPDADYAMRIACALGVEPIDGCWAAQARNPARRRAIERVIERATTGDPAYAAYAMVRDCGSSRSWAERVRAAVSG